MFVVAQLCLWCVHAEANGFTCYPCQKFRRALRNAHTQSDMRVARDALRQHLQVVFGARKALATHKLHAFQQEGYCLVMADAADQAKLGSPSIRQGGRAGSQVKKIKQQLIGVIVHGLGYYLYRRLPVTQKGANLTCTLLMDMLAKKVFLKVHTLVLQWDGE